MLLVSSPDDVSPPWSLPSLRDHLQDEGHEVVVTGDIDALGLGHTPVDVIHAFGWRAARAVAAREGRVPWVLTAPWGGFGPDSDVAAVARGAEQVLCASSDSARDANRLGVSHQRLLVMPIGVDVDVFTRHGPSANRTTTQRIMVRALGPGDGVLDVVAALPAVPGAELVILVGTTAGDDVELHQEALVHAAHEVGVRARVALALARDPLERAWLLRSADVVVSVAGQRGDHAIVAEAMACGKAVVVTATGPQRDLVVNAVTGMHVPAHRARGLALTLRNLLQEPFSLEGMGLAGADRALSRSAWPRVAHEFGSVYVRVSGRSAFLDEWDADAVAADAARTGS